MKTRAVSALILSFPILAFGVSHMESVAVAQIQYVSPNRTVFAQQSGKVVTDTFSADGYWDGFVFSGVSGSSNRSSAILRGSLAANAIDLRFDVSSDPGGNARSRLFTILRLAEATLVSFNCAYQNFVNLDITEFNFSLVGSGYNYTFTADPRTEFVEFSQANVLLGPGDYTMELDVSTIGFNGLIGDFALTAAPVPAPGAAGLALATVAAAASRRRREG